MSVSAESLCVRAYRRPDTKVRRLGRHFESESCDSTEIEVSGVKLVSYGLSEVSLLTAADASDSTAQGVGGVSQLQCGRDGGADPHVPGRRRVLHQLQVREGR
jgi:hypothetical protein